MKTLKALSLFVAFAACAFAQSVTASTTISAAMDTNQQFVTLTSGTGVVAPSNTTAGTLIFIGREGMTVTGAATSGTTFPVIRGTAGKVTSHASGALAWVALTNSGAYIQDDPGVGGGNLPAIDTLPKINTQNGKVWTCVQPGTQTTTHTCVWQEAFRPQPVSVAVASAAGTIAPSGSLFHVTGTAAITGFTAAVGFESGPFCIIPDGAFTTTTAGNIALASTAVVSKVLCYSYDPAAAKPYFPSY